MINQIRSKREKQTLLAEKQSTAAAASSTNPLASLGIRGVYHVRNHNGQRPPSFKNIHRSGRCGRRSLVTALLDFQAKDHGFELNHGFLANVEAGRWRIIPAEIVATIFPIAFIAKHRLGEIGHD
jgi:hypothetical protein